jgi:hypothetical protein
VTTLAGHYPDLAGKTAVVAGASRCTPAVVEALAANGVLVAVVAPDRSLVDECLAAVAGHGAAVLGVTSDPGSAQTWSRIRPHVEQRLGPIDVAVALGDAVMRTAVRQALEADMTARRRGVVIEVAGGGEAAASEATDGSPRADHVRYRLVVTALPEAVDSRDVATIVVAGASDAVTAAAVRIDIG